MNKSVSSVTQKFILSFISLITGLLCLELSLHLLKWKPYLRDEWMLKSVHHLPNDNLLFFSDSINEILSRETIDDQRTVIFLGDSFTEGFPVVSVDSYPNKLAAVLHGQGYDINPVNAGVGAYAPDQEYKLFKDYLLPRFKPSLVIWQFYSNDLWDNIFNSLYSSKDGDLVEIKTSTHRLNLRSQMYPNLPSSQALLENSRLLRVGFYLLEKIWVYQLLDRTDPISWSTEKIDLEISKMNQLAASYGFKVIYVLVAPQAKYLIEDRDDQPQSNYPLQEHNLLRELLSRQTNFVDLYFKNFSELLLSRDINDYYVNDGSDGQPVGDRHFNALGYELMAKIIASKAAELLSQ